MLQLKHKMHSKTFDRDRYNKRYEKDIVRIIFYEISLEL